MCVCVCLSSYFPDSVFSHTTQDKYKLIIYKYTRRNWPIAPQIRACSGYQFQLSLHSYVFTHISLIKIRRLSPTWLLLLSTKCYCIDLLSGKQKYSRKNWIFRVQTKTNSNCYRIEFNLLYLQNTNEMNMLINLHNPVSSRSSNIRFIGILTGTTI